MVTLLSIVTACICVIAQAVIDHSGRIIKAEDGICAGGEMFVNGTGCEPVYPSPTVKGFSTAFSTLMFAFGAVSIFPTIQADMTERSKFPISAMMGCSSKLFYYLSTLLFQGCVILNCFLNN